MDHRHDWFQYYNLKQLIFVFYFFFRKSFDLGNAFPNVSYAIIQI